jgi:hypothetical protein
MAQRTQAIRGVALLDRSVIESGAPLVMSKTTRASSVATSRRAERLVAARRKELAASDDEFFAGVGGVAQAIDALRKALSKLSSALDGRQYEQASALGYEAVASEFVFL